MGDPSQRPATQPHRRKAPARARARTRKSVLQTSDGKPIHIVHVVSECWPYARSGGLGEAVASLATYQAAAGLPTTVVMPLYQQVRSVVSAMEPLGAPFTVQLGPTKETGRLWRAKGTPRGTDVVFVEHPGFFDRPALYGEGRDYPDNHRRFAFFSLAALTAMPRIAPMAILHAHDWHAAISSSTCDRRVSIRTIVASRPFCRCTMPSGHFPPSTLPNRYPWELFSWEFLGGDKVNWLKGA
jgi:hypothetical protein